jgi:hypothetical protein
LSEHEITPSSNTKVIFGAATAFVRKYSVNKKPIMLTNNHKGTRITLDAGWLIIDQEWYPFKKI